MKNKNKNKTNKKTRARGNIVIWLTGNDVYSRLSGLASFDDKKLENIGNTATTVWRKLQDAGPVLVLGPLPRPDGDTLVWDTGRDTGPTRPSSTWSADWLPSAAPQTPPLCVDWGAYREGWRDRLPLASAWTRP